MRVSHELRIKAKPYFKVKSKLLFFRRNHSGSQKDIKPILRKLARDFERSKKKSISLEKSFLIGRQHILGTTVDMLSVMKEWGLKGALVNGKIYSTYQPCVEELIKLGYHYVDEGHPIAFGCYGNHDMTFTAWNKALSLISDYKYEQVIILDDGCSLLKSTPAKLFSIPSVTSVVGIEQTSYQTSELFFNSLIFNVINVADSTVKEKLEYPRVAETIACKVTNEFEMSIKINLNREPIIGVVGFGKMGQAIANQFVNKGYRVYVCDSGSIPIKINDNINYENNLPGLIERCNVILGCTGKDITASVEVMAAIENSKEKKYCISTSSNDIEFKNLLQNYQRSYVKSFGKHGSHHDRVPYILSDVLYRNKNNQLITIKRGGFPINFDNTRHSVPPDQIWPTRAALLLACLDARSRHNEFVEDVKEGRSPQVYDLDQNAQKMILSTYEHLNHETSQINPMF